MSLKRLGDTRWSSHYGALVNLIHMFSFVLDVIETIIEDGLDFDQRAEDGLNWHFVLLNWLCGKSWSTGWQGLFCR